MNFNLTKPCANCPFRSDKLFYLRIDRASEILTAITRHQQTFACHKTTKLAETERGSDMVETPKSEHCAGALIMLEKLEQPNQLMRVAERLGVYDRSKLDMAAPVFDTPGEMLRSMRSIERNRSKLIGRDHG